MCRTPGWETWTWPARALAALVLTLIVLLALTGALHLAGLFERLLTLVAAAGLATLAYGVLRRRQAER